MARMSIHVIMVLTGSVYWLCSAEDPGCGADSCVLDADTASLMQMQAISTDIAAVDPADKIISKNMKVVYALMTSPKPKFAAELAAVEETWGKELAPQTLLIVGTTGSTPGVIYDLAPMCEDGHTQNAGMSCKEATALAEGHKLGADWIVFGATDMYIFTKRIEEMLEKEDSSKPQILGIFGCGEGKYCEDHKAGLCGGGGYLISRGALEKMVGNKKGATQSYVQECIDTSIGVGGNWSDQVTACVARRSHVKEVQIQGLYGWRLDSEEIYKEKIASSNPTTLTLHYVDPKLMHMIHKNAKDIGAVSFSQSGHDVAHADEQAAYIQMVHKERTQTESAAA